MVISLLEFIGSWILITCGWFGMSGLSGFQDGWITVFGTGLSGCFQDRIRMVGCGFSGFLRIRIRSWIWIRRDFSG